MSSPKRPRPTLGQALLVLVPGLIVMVVSIGRVMADFQSGEIDVPLLPMIGLSVGAAFFAVGLMMLLVAIVRPFFAKRAADEQVEQARRSGTERSFRGPS